MNKAKYLSTASEGGNGMYPLSTQTLDFIQGQLELLQALSNIGGRRYILREPDGSQAGIVVIDGEVLPLASTPTSGKAIKVSETKQDIVADGTTYREARVIRSAKYISTYSQDLTNVYPIADFNNFATNKNLYASVQNIKGFSDIINSRLVIVSGVFSRSQLDSQFDNVRMHCKQGSAVINGASEYTINVYKSGHHCTQEQIMPNMQTYKREYNFTKKAWSDFSICSENLHLEVKVVDRTTVFVRHGVIPEGMQLVLLRKKKRTRKRRSGGSRTINPAYKGKEALRLPKNQYVHFKGIILSTGEPNKWYVPKCIAVSDMRQDSRLIGKEMPTLCQSLIYPHSSNVYKIQSTRKPVAPPISLSGYASTGYAKVGLQFASANAQSKSGGGEMVKMKYRLWFYRSEAVSCQPHYQALRGFSVE